MDIDELATKVEKLCGMRSKNAAGEVWIFGRDDKQIHAWGNGEWKAQLWARNGGDAATARGQSEILGQPRDADSLACAIADYALKMLEE